MKKLLALVVALVVVVFLSARASVREAEAEAALWDEATRDLDAGPGASPAH